MTLDIFGVFGTHIVSATILLTGRNSMGDLVNINLATFTDQELLLLPDLDLVNLAFPPVDHVTMTCILPRARFEKKYNNQPKFGALKNVLGM